MKIFYFEGTAEELKVNRSLMDALCDIAHGIVQMFNKPVSDETEEILQEDEDDE